ncbi:MAG: dTMP kinase [Spirochaetes bacterium]|nr:dTMP kinase [Spirochaetota bacterium]
MMPSDIINKLIVFEGIDGSGKTTVISIVAKKIMKHTEVSILREPTSSQYGVEIRELLSNSANPPLDRIMDLFINDRRLDVQKNIMPALDNGRIVLMDRYYYSNAAYQGAMGESPEKILARNIENNFPSPDMVFFMKISPEAALDRISKRKNEAEIAEECFEKTEFLKKVESVYADILPDHTYIIDATESPEYSAEKIFNIISARYL